MLLFLRIFAALLAEKAFEFPGKVFAGGEVPGPLAHLGVEPVFEHPHVRREIRVLRDGYRDLLLVGFGCAF
jgi:hypothetical protein